MYSNTTIIGNLGNDPDARNSASTPITELRVATSYGSGDKKETEWHRVITFGKTAETAAKYLHKGSKVFISGRLRTRTYEKDGQVRYITELLANEMKMLDSKGEGESGKSRQDAAAQDDMPF